MNNSHDPAAWYRDYYARRGADRNDPFQNAGVDFQQMANDRALLAVLRGTVPYAPVAERTFLDVGCGSGATLLHLLRLGFEPGNLAGIDIQPERVAAARCALPPTIRMATANATQLPFSDGAFDYVFESTMLIQITEEETVQRIAAEMLRVCKPGGYVIISDWRYSRPGSDYRAVTRRRLRALFNVPDRNIEMLRVNGALLPPLGRFLSARLPSLYILAQRIFPFACAHVTTAIRKAFTMELMPRD